MKDLPSIFMKNSSNLAVIVVFPAKQHEEEESGLGYGGIYRAALAQVEALLSVNINVTVLTASVLFARRSAAMGATVHQDDSWHSGVTPLLLPSCWKQALRARRTKPIAILFHGARGWLWGACFFSGIARVGVMHTGGFGKTQRLRYQLALNQRVLDSTSKSPAGRGMRFAQVSNGLTNADLARFHQVAEKEKTPSSEGTLTIGFMGRFAPSKGLDVLLEAFHQVREIDPCVRLMLAGTGNVDVQAMAREQGLEDSVKCIGWTNDTCKFLSGIDIFCLPSRKEPFGMVVLEAMAAGVPVVATRSGGPDEIIQDGETGLLVPPGDAAALAGALLKLVRNTTERSRLAHAALRSVNDRFGPEPVGRAYVQAFKTLGLLPKVTSQ